MFEQLRRRRSGSVRLVGVTHVSPASRPRVVDAVREERPDHVAIELDADRFRRLWNGDRAGVRGLVRSDLSPTALLLAAAFGLRQRRLFAEMDVEPGEADFLPAARTGRAVGATVSLIDAPKTETLNALAAGAFSASGVVAAVERLVTLSSDGALRAAVDDLHALDEEYGLEDASTAETVELLDAMPLDDVERLTDALGTLAPAVAETVLDARDERMAGRLHWLREHGRSTVAVVGRAHVPGMRRLLDDPERIPSAHVVEPRSVRFVEE